MNVCIVAVLENRERLHACTRWTRAPTSGIHLRRATEEDIDSDLFGLISIFSGSSQVIVGWLQGRSQLAEKLISLFREESGCHVYNASPVLLHE